MNEKTCPITLRLLGDYWTLRILDSLREKEVRFCELQRMLDDLNPVTLTDRLKKLEEAKLIKRSEETIDKISVSYSLSPLGAKATPIIDAYDAFARTLSKQ